MARQISTAKFNAVLAKQRQGLTVRAAAKAVGVGRNTTQRIYSGTYHTASRPAMGEAPPRRPPPLKPRTVPQYTCPGCERVVYLRPCVICAARSQGTTCP